MSHPVSSAEPHVDQSLGPRELLAILAFWALLAAIAASGRILDPRVEVQPAVARALVTLSVAEYALWALLSVPIVWMAGRLSIEGGARLGRVLLFIVVGIALAIAVDLFLAWLRQQVLPAPTRRGRFGEPGQFGGGGGRGRRGGGGFGGPRPFGLGFLDDLMVYFAVLGFGIARDYFLRYRARLADSARLEAHAAQLQAQLAEARLTALRAQLDPHFLFNTLNAVSALVERDPKGVRKMIARLADLLRRTLEGPPRQEVPLEEELDLLRRYVDIMEVRFQGRLEATLDADADVRAALVPNMVLQPLVENALKHGAGASEGPARVEVRARREGDELVLTVRDDGPGPSGNGSAAGTGTGLRNTTSRLEQLYGTRQRFSLTATSGGGAIAEVRLPFHVTPNAGDATHG